MCVILLELVEASGWMYDPRVINGMPAHSVASDSLRLRGL